MMLNISNLQTMNTYFACNPSQINFGIYLWGSILYKKMKTVLNCLVITKSRYEYLLLFR